MFSKTFYSSNCPTLFASSESDQTELNQWINNFEYVNKPATFQYFQMHVCCQRQSERAKGFSIQYSALLFAQSQGKQQSKYATNNFVLCFRFMSQKQMTKVRLNSEFSLRSLTNVMCGESCAIQTVLKLGFGCI